MAIAHKTFLTESKSYLKTFKYKIKSDLAIFLLLSIFTFLSCSQPPEGAVVKLDGSYNTPEDLTTKIYELTKAGNVHGLSISIFNQNKQVFSHNFGEKNVEKKEVFSKLTNIYAASLSTTVFAALVMKLVEGSHLDLDTPLESYLPKKIHEYEPSKKWFNDYSNLKNDTVYHGITARMCLSHTSGLSDYRWVQIDNKLKINRKPGIRFEYSGEGYMYLQFVIEKIMGKGIVEIAQEELFSPLGMNNSSFQWQEKFEKDFASGHSEDGVTNPKGKSDTPIGGATLETTLEDYSLFIEASLQQKILTPQSWEEIFKSQIRIRSKNQFGSFSLIDGTQNDKIKLGYGLGWGIFKTKYGLAAFKEGGDNGFQHYTIVFPKAQSGVIIMSNSENTKNVLPNLLEATIGDVYSPWGWLGYLPNQ